MPAVPIYTVHRLGWRVHDGAWYRLPGSTPVRSFADPVEARSFARDHDARYRRAFNPFRCGGPRLFYQTHFTAPLLCDWFLDHGIDAPGVSDDSAVWAAWWDAKSFHWTPRERNVVWDALDRVRFADVCREVPGKMLHLVAYPVLEDDPVDLGFRSSGSLSYVGCLPYLLTGRQATADDMCRELYRTRMAREGNYVPPTVGTKGWERSGGRRVEEWMLDTHRAPPTDYVERLPCPYHGGQVWSGQTLYIILRRHWRLDPSPDSWRWYLPQARTCGIPVAAYDTLAAADAVQAELEAAARAEVASPFRFGSAFGWSTEPSNVVWGVLRAFAEIDIASLWEDLSAPDAVWCRWFDDTAPGLTDEQLETTWALFDKLRFYEIVAVEYRE